MVARRYTLHKEDFPIMENKEIFHSNSDKLTIALLKHWFSQAKDEGLRLFVMADCKRTVLETFRETLRGVDEFKDKRIKIISKENVDEEAEAIGNYARGTLDCDILLATPTLSIGVRLNGLFGIAVINTSNNPQRAFTSPMVVQMMTRDADCPKIIWQEKEMPNGLPRVAMNQKIREPKYWNNLTEKDWAYLSKKIEEIYTHETNFFRRNYLTGEYLPEAIPVIKRTIKRHNWSVENRENLYTNTKEHCESLGATWHDLEQTKALIDKQELKEIGLAVPKYVQENLEKRLLGELEHNADSFARFNEISHDLRIDAKSQHLTAKQIAQWDDKDFKNNEERWRELHSDISNPSELNQLASQLLQLGKDFGKMKILTDEQFKQSEIYQEYFGDNFARFQRLAQDSLQLYEPRKLETQLDALRWSGKLLQKFNYYTQIKTESETNPNKERKNLYQQAKKEHSAQFNKWAKANRTEGKQIRYDDWLWFMLNDKELREFRFKPKTKQYIQTFPRLEIEEYSRRFNAHVI